MVCPFHPAVSAVSNYVMSHELVSKYLAMVSERAELNNVLEARPRSASG